ncbi:putative cucumisin [Helianthus anomalus]
MIIKLSSELNVSLYPEGEFAYGSGHIDPLKATNPGLVYETSTEEYLRVWCNVSRSLGSVIPANASCPHTLTPKEINYPSMAVQLDMKKTFTVSFPRTVTNVGHTNSTYVAFIEGNHSNLSINVEPNTLKFTTLNQKMKFVVTIRGKRMNPSTIKRLALLWIDGVHKVRSPIVLHAMGTSNGEKAINPSTFHMIFVILMIMILMC